MKKLLVLVLAFVAFGCGTNPKAGTLIDTRNNISYDCYNLSVWNDDNTAVCLCRQGRIVLNNDFAVHWDNKSK